MLKKLTIALLIGSLGLSACSTETHYAPVMDAATIERIPKAGIYHVQPHETLYSIAWRYGLDYRYVANRNNMVAPYHIVAGQLLYLRGKLKKPVPAAKATLPAATLHPSAPITPIKTVIEPHAKVVAWRWPARGSVVAGFSGLNKGINIAGSLGDPIYATAPGLVVYSGDGLRGYGNLIIIKHNAIFLTAYAHNSVLLVKEGAVVKAGQKIAEMGRMGTQRVMLHFEIRRSGQPVNPLNYLR